jgi:hypothetical protein
VTNAIRALLVTPDPWLMLNFTDISREVGIEAQASAKTDGIPEELGRAKYEAVLLDFDLVANAMYMLAAIRQHPSNRNAVVFAVASGAEQGQQALHNGANVLLKRPLEAQQVRRDLYAAYDLMVRERRRYFRCARELPVLLIHASSGSDLRCTSMNISSSGMALNTPSALNAGEEVQVILFLPDGELAVRAIGTVVWDDKHGKAGVSFKCTSPQHQTDLDSWLDTQLHKLLNSGHSAPRIST